MISPLNSSELDITDEDNVFILQATLNIENAADLRENVLDQLIASSTASFEVSHRGNTTLCVEAIGPNRLITTHEQLEDFLRGVAYATDDQAPDVVRNLSVVVEEFPVGEAARTFTFIPIYIQPVNDQPVLPSSQVMQAPLTDYLPQETENLGFNASFLLSPDNVTDIDRLSQISQDFIGLAIIGQVVIGLGAWQYRVGDSDWVDFPEDLSQCNPLFVDPSTRIRFSPSPNPDKLNENAGITYQAWDGSGRDSICTTLTDRGKAL